MSLAGMLRSSCTLLRQSSTKDSVGPGASASYAAVAGTAGTPCDVQPAGAAVTERFGQAVLLGAWTVYTAADLGARATDIIQVGTRYFLVIEGGGQGGGFSYDQWPAEYRARQIVFGP